MEIQYQRNLKNSYMVVIEKNQPLNMDGALAEKMFARQEIQGLLSWVSMEHGKDMTFWYRITGLQSLSDWLDQHLLDARLMGRLLAALLALQEELPRYYLKPQHLLLRGDQIFLQPSGNGVQLCYEPLWERQPQEALAELMEQLLPKIDHEDQQAVALGYGLYELCRKPNADVWGFVLSQIQPTLEEAAEPELFAVQDSEKEESDAPALEPDMPQPADTHRKLSFRKEYRKEKNEKKDRTKNKNNDRNRDINRNRNDDRNEDKQKDRKKNIIKLFSESAAYTNDQEKYKKRTPVFPLSYLRKKEKQPQQAPLYVFEPEEEAIASEDPTVYLGGGQQTEGRLEYVGGGAESSFLIEGASFLIGTVHGQADGCLQASGVSRSHARITKEKTFYYIEDLNSRNGTYLNGELLPYKQKRRLQSGDRLRFAREEYVFR